MKRFIKTTVALMLLLSAGTLRAQFYAYPQTLFGFYGVYSFRFMHTAYLFEDDLDRLFYPVKLSEIEGGRLFTTLSNPFGNEYLFDPTQPTNNQLVLGAKTNLFMNLSPLFLTSEFGATQVDKRDTTYLYNYSSADNDYRNRDELRDSSYTKNSFGSKSFLLSMGSGSFGFLFMYVNANSKHLPGLSGTFPFGYGNFTYDYARYDNLNGNLLEEQKSQGYAEIDTSYTPILGAFSFAFGPFSGMLFAGFVSVKTSDTGSVVAEHNTDPANPFTGDRYNNGRASNTGAGGPLFGLQGDYGFGSETWKANLMFSYALRVLSNGNGVSRAVRYQTSWDGTVSTSNPVLTTVDTLLQEFSYGAMRHDINLYLRNRYALGERVLFGAGLGIYLGLSSDRYDYTRVLNKSYAFSDANGNGSVDGADYKTTTYTQRSFKRDISQTIFAYYLPVGLEIAPVEAWSNFRVRFGGMYSRTSWTTKTRDYDHSAESKSRTETAFGTTETYNDITVPGENVSITRLGASSTQFMYGASWTVADRVIIDFTGFGYGLFTPSMWNVSVILKY